MRPTLVFVAVSSLCAAAPLSRARAAPASCDQLAGMEIPASAIGLPTSGASVTSATAVAAAGTTGDYCKATVAIHPVDPAAPDVLAQVNLPAGWNGKAVMFGGGGYDGSIPATTGNYFNGPVGVPVPLGQGYVTFGSNSGHVANAFLGSRDGSFATSDEALRNFAGDALKKTHDVAVDLVQAFYGRRPARTYFVGGSSGGREALWVVQQTPQDFDGAVSEYPAWNAGTLDLQFGRITRALAQPGAYPDPAKQLLWVRAVVAACDGLDGLVDGLVSDVADCRFDPRTATVADGSAPLRCPGGADTGDGCLSDAQIAAIRVYGTPLFLPYRTGSGEFYYPGFNVFAGADLTGPLDLAGQQPTSAIVTGSQTAPAYGAMPYLSVFWDQWVKYFVTGDAAFDSLALDPQRPGPWQERIGDLLGLQDVNRTDLSAFARRGGKLILMHGLADGLVATDATTEYYLRVGWDMGWSRVRRFVRYYTIPGQGHVYGSPFAAGGGFYTAWDPLGALDRWVETGEAPGTLVATDQNAATRGRTRPVCEWPSWPRYDGTGDPNSAASFRCVVSGQR